MASASNSMSAATMMRSTINPDMSGTRLAWYIVDQAEPHGSHETWTGAR